MTSQIPSQPGVGIKQRANGEYYYQEEHSHQRSIKGLSIDQIKRLIDRAKADIEYYQKRNEEVEKPPFDLGLRHVCLRGIEADQELIRVAQDFLDAESAKPPKAKEPPPSNCCIIN